MKISVFSFVSLKHPYFVKFDSSTRVEVVPTLLIFKNGKVVYRIEGLVSEEEIVNKVQECK